MALAQVALLVLAVQGRHEVAARLTFGAALWSISHQLSFLVAIQVREEGQVELQRGQHWAWVPAGLVACSRHSDKGRSHHRPVQA